MVSRKMMDRLSLPRGSTPFGRVVEHLAWLISGKGVGAVLSLIYLAIATRTLGPDNFGRFILVVSAASAINAFMTFNIWQVVVKYGQPFVRNRDAKGLGRLVGYCAAMDLAAGIAGCAIAAVVTFLFDDLINLPDALAWQAFGFSAILMLTIRSTPMGILRLFNRFDTAALSETMIPIMRMIGALVALAYGPSIAAFLLAWATAELVCAAAYWFFAMRTVRDEIGKLKPSGFWGIRKEMPGLSRFMAITNVSSTLGAVAAQLPVLMVGAFTGPAGAGFFRLGYQLAQAMTKISSLFSRSLYSELAHVHAHGKRAELFALFRKTSLIALGAGVISAAAILLLGKPVLLLMSGPAYADAFPLLALLGIAAAISLAGVGFEPLLLATNGAGLSLFIRGVMIIALIIGLAILLPIKGAAGAAIAVLIASTLHILMLWGAAFRQLRR